MNNSKTVIWSFILCLSFLFSNSVFTQIDTLTAKGLIKYGDSFFDKYSPNENDFSLLTKGEKYLEKAKQKIDAEGNQLTAENGEYYYLKCWVSLTRENFQNAEAYCTKAIEIRRLISDTSPIDLGKSIYNLAFAYAEQQKYHRSIEYAKEAHKVFLKDENTPTFYLYHSTNLVANSSGQLGRYAEAVEYSEKALEFAKEVKGGAIFLADAYHNLAIWQRNLGLIETAINNLNTGKDLIINFPQTNEVILSLHKFYQSIGRCYEDKENHFRSLENYEEALRLCKKLPDRYLKEKSIAYEDFALGLQERDVQDTMIFKNLEQALNIRRKLNSVDSVTIHQNFCTCYKDLKKLEKAEYHCRVALNTRLKKGMNVNQAKLASSYIGLADILMIKKQFEEAEDAYRAAYDLLKTSYYLEGHKHSALAAQKIGVCLRERDKKQLAESRKWLDIAFEENKYDSKHPEKVLSPFVLFTTFNEKGGLLAELYNEYGDATFLFQALENFEKGIEVLEEIKKKRYFVESKKILYESVHALQGNIIATCLKINKLTGDETYKERAFRASEFAKAQALYASMQEQNAEKLGNIPQKLLKEENDIFQKITVLETSIYENKQQGKSVDSLKAALFRTNQERINFLQKLEANYGKYYDLKYDYQIKTTAYIQKKLLAKNQTLLEYFVGEYGIFIFLIQKKNVEIFEIKKDFPLETWINQMLEKGICQATNVSNYRKSIPIYAKAAQKLYEKLIPETLAEKLTDELIILPDGVLGFVPFEALLTKLPEDFYSWKKYDFFIREHQISYIYSATLLEVMQEKKLPAQKNMTLLAMAPFPEKNASDRPSESPSSSRKGESFKPLKHSTTECQEVSKLFGGDFYIGKEANKNRFRKEAENYRILHISTHAKANFEVSDFAFLAFGYQHSEEEVEKLYSKDLYNFQLNAEMVVLSACETGIGTAKKGEGIISLARAFSYAGAKSVFATLWQVDDEKTKDLVINFYANLKKGWRKDEALYEAKKTSLENEDNAHPYFWAGLIGIGDMREIE